KRREVKSMPIIYETDLKKDISSKNFAHVYLIYGDDSFLKNHYKDTLAKKASYSDTFFNLQKFEGDIYLQDVFDAVIMFPMMAERKSVVLSDFDFEHSGKSDFDRLIQLISSGSDSCTLIICFDTVEFDAKRGAKEKKLIDAVNKAGGSCAEINHRSITSLVKMLSDGAKKRGCKFDEIAVRHLIEVVGNDLSTLKNELEKLCAYVGDNGIIDKSVVDLVSIKSVDASVYEYVKELLACRVSNALSMLDDMFFMRIEPMAILSVTASSLVDIYRAYTANISGVKKSDIASDFKYPKNKLFLIDRATQSLRRFDSKKIRLALKTIADTDKSLKSFGADPRTILEQLTVKLIYIIEKGETVDNA
ncbi:MAG: DNA polymerase III subunit delta, partial [Clostridia bacterium]|nr:DNA polymerase III subunit delta [Clostridia bacterium]